MANGGGPVSPAVTTAMSVQDRAKRTFAEGAPLTFRIAMVADMMGGTGPSKTRDRALGTFWPTEPMLAGTIYSMAARMAAKDFKLTGPTRTKRKYKRLLLSADFGSGNGWIAFLMKVTTDLLTQDNGAFIELLRPPGKGPTTAVRGIAHLDAQRCTRTGDPMQPVEYQSYGGTPRKLQWYEVLPMCDMPSPREEHKGMGLCAVSRVLRKAQTLRDIGMYTRQKLAGKRTPGILFVQGVRRKDVEQAIEVAMEQQLAEGETLYTRPLVVTTMDSAVPVNTQMVELAGLPDGYSEDEAMKWYIATLALGFGTDYTDLAPLPGGNLGSATQATEMASRARGKGPGAILQQLELGINWWVLPEGTEFQFISSDAAAERERIEQSGMRARARADRIASSEITTEQALQLAVLEGDAPESWVDPVIDILAERVGTVVKAIDDIQETLEKTERVLTHLGK